jgi:ribosome biogenesis GTPase A
VDVTKAAGILLNELRAGQIGRISLQKPPAPKVA